MLIACRHDQTGSSCITILSDQQVIAYMNLVSEHML